MEQLQTGNLLIRAHEEKLLLKIAGNSQGSTELRLDEVSAILAFLNAYRDNYFDRRASFRLDLSQIPSEQLESLRVSALTLAGYTTLHPIDLSVTGMGAEPVFNIGEPGGCARITISFAGHSVELKAKIIRGGTSGEPLGLKFKRLRDKDGRPKTHPELIRIFNELEALWLNQHLQLDWNDH